MYLNLDTQGYDLRVVGGADETINRTITLQTEVSVRLIYAGMPSFIESHQVLATW